MDDFEQEVKELLQDAVAAGNAYEKAINVASEKLKEHPDLKYLMVNPEITKLINRLEELNNSLQK